MWRAGLRSELLNAGSAKVCFHHERKFGSIFERGHTKYANIFNRHKNTKNSEEWPFEMTTMTDGKEIQSVPGFQLCRSCSEEAQTHCHNVSEVKDYDIAIASDLKHLGS